MRRYIFCGTVRIGKTRPPLQRKNPTDPGR